MKIISEKPTARGKKRLIVEIDEGETLIAINPDKYYTLGEPLHEDVFAGHILDAPFEAHWCSFSQKWIK